MSQKRTPESLKPFFISVWHPVQWLLLCLLCLSTAQAAGTDTPTLREGDSVIEADLLNEDGEAISLSHADRPTVMTFIFTRCAAMEFCPRMNSQFEALQEAAQAGNAGDVRLLSITLDPEHDRPKRLKEFSEAIGADPEIWNFATGTKEEIDRLTKAFRVFTEKSDGTINHTLCTALVTPDGTLQKIWRGNFWEPEDVVEELNKLEAKAE